MKKLFSVITVMFVVLSLSACDALTGETTDVLEQQIADLESENQELANENEDLLALLDSYKEYTVDVMFTVGTIDLQGNETTVTIGYNSEETVALKDVIVGLLNADVQDSAYGSYIANVNNMTVPYGSYIAISENGEMAMVGLDDLVIDDGDVFTFEVMWWDTTQQAVYEAIQLFIENQLDTFLSTTYIDYNVLVGCQTFCVDYLSESDIETYLGTLTLSTTQDYFKAITIAKYLSDDTLLNTYLNAFETVVSTGAYGQTALGLIAYDAVSTTIDYSTYVSDALSYYTTSSPYDEGLDAGGLGLVALSNYTAEPGVQDLIDAYVTWIEESQLTTGGVKTRDMVWGDVTYPGVENAASISQVIMALVANGIDPAGDDFTVDGHNLVTRLIEFQLEDGSFDWDLTDEVTNDLAFSTPQAFLALVTYYDYSNSYGALTNPYE